MSQVFMIAVYPVYYHVFRLVPASSMPRLAFLCLLPLLKTVNRQLFYHSSRKTDGGAEFVPQVVVFNADVLGALFVAFCMQYKPSLAMAVGIAVAKVLTAAVSFWDLHAAGRQLAALEAQIRACQPPNSVRVVKASVLDEVEQIVAKHGAISFASFHAKVSTTRGAAEIPRGRGEPSSAVISPFPRGLRWLCGPRVAPIVNPPAKSPDDKLVKAKSRVDLSQGGEDKAFVELRRAERLYVEFVTKLLYKAEFAILIEYVEVIVPVLYRTWQPATDHASPLI